MAGLLLGGVMGLAIGYAGMNRYAPEAPTGVLVIDLFYYGFFLGLPCLISAILGAVIWANLDREPD